MLEASVEVRLSLRLRRFTCVRFVETRLESWKPERGFLYVAESQWSA
jgi:hypothetical protein